MVSVGWEGAIVRSTDRGRTWSVVPSGTAKRLNGVWGSGHVFIAVGQHNTVLRSIDGGATWQTPARR
jgi:photosystem II stability/assembly factor-like uncharacterized protein